MMKELADLRGLLRSGIPTGAGGSRGAIARVAEVTLELLQTAKPESGKTGNAARG
jgi:hypothetical protein